MAVVRRKDLKPARKVSDEDFLRGAQRSATRAANRLERERRAEAAQESFRDHDRAVRGAKARPTDPESDR